MGVITNGSGGGAGGGIRYNAQTDMIQVKVNGSWVDTPYKAYGTFDGTIYEDGSEAISIDFLGNIVKSSNSFHFGTGTAYGYVWTSEAIDLTGFNSIKYMINGTTYTHTIPVGQTTRYVGLVRTAVNGWYSITSYISPTQSSTGAVSSYQIFNSNTEQLEQKVFTKMWLSV